MSLGRFLGEHTCCMLCRTADKPRPLHVKCALKLRLRKSKVLEELLEALSSLKWSSLQVEHAARTKQSCSKDGNMF